MFNLQSGQKIAFSYVTRGIIWKINMQELWVLCMTHRLNVLYKCMKFHGLSSYRADMILWHMDRQTDARGKTICLPTLPEGRHNFRTFMVKFSLLTHKEFICSSQMDSRILWESSCYSRRINVPKFRTLFSFCSLIKCWLSRLEFTKMLVTKANREDPDQTASSGTACSLSGSEL